MPRYFFHVRGDARAFDDQTGEMCPSPEAAEAKAANIASELAEDGETYRGHHLVVTDHDRNEIIRAAVVDCGRVKKHK
jgi:hypothetical protein